MELATLSFVERKEGVMLAGKSGTGKSHIAQALLLLGCQKLYGCRYTSAAQMLKELMSGLLDGSLHQELKIFTAPLILLIDEVGFDRLEQESARNASLFLKVIDARYRNASTLFTTNIGFKSRGDYLGDPRHHHRCHGSHGPLLHHHQHRRAELAMHESKKLNKAIKKQTRQDRLIHQPLDVIYKTPMWEETPVALWALSVSPLVPVPTPSPLLPHTPYRATSPWVQPSLKHGPVYYRG